MDHYPLNIKFKVLPAVLFACKSKELSAESVKPPSVPNNTLDPSLDYLGSKTRVQLNGSCLKQDKITFAHGKNTKNIHCLWDKKNFFLWAVIWYFELLKIGAVSLIKNINDIDEYKHSWYCIGVDTIAVDKY